MHQPCSNDQQFKNKLFHANVFILLSSVVLRCHRILGSFIGCKSVDVQGKKNLLQDSELIIRNR
jgi:hypothetical protein